VRPLGSVRARLEAAAGLSDLDRLAPRIDEVAVAVAETVRLADGLERRVAELEQLLVPVLQDRIDGDG
jgi:hypothetical protein